MWFRRHPSYLCIWCCLIKTIVNKKILNSCIKIWQQYCLIFVTCRHHKQIIFFVYSIYICISAFLYVPPTVREWICIFIQQVCVLFYTENSQVKIWIFFLHRTLALVWTGIRSFPQPSTVLVHSVTIKSQKCHLEGTFAQSPGYIASRSLIALTKPKSNCSWNNMLMFMILIKYN